jgi:lipoate-protein ligase A
MPPTKSRPFRFIYTGSSKGSVNMAMDEAVYTGLKDGHSTPALRLYTWDPATISIGYFQNASDIDLEQCREDGIGVVRRMTGGRAVLHDEELTYSILFTEEDFLPFRKKDIFFFIAQCLVNSLEALGIESKVAEKTRGDLRSANCFASPAQFEIESLEQGKLIGSAQVIKDGIVLQHGAIPLTGSYRAISKYLNSDSDFAKSISSLNQALGSAIDPDSLLSSLKRGFGQHVLLEEGSLNEYEMALTERLTCDKYGSDTWTLRK